MVAGKGSLAASLVVLAVVFLIGGVSQVEAACSGAGGAFTCTSGSTAAQVNTAITSGTDPVVVTIAAGSYNWGAGTPISGSATKDVTVICETVGACTVTSSSTTFTIPSTSSTKLFRISGFTGTHTGSFWFWGCTPGSCTNIWTQLRIDHNDITSNEIIVFVGDVKSTQYIYGVVDHNTFRHAVSNNMVQWIGATDATPEAPPLGTGSNLFFEDNEFIVSNLTDLGVGATDGWGQASFVFRYNVVRNTRILMHAVTHGGGPSNFEVYNNTIIQTDADGLGCYRCIHHQGSNTYMVFNNTFLGVGTKSTDALVVQHYCDFAGPPVCIDGGGTHCDGTQARDGNRSPIETHRGYPCFRQPGRDVTAAYKPMYAWNNKWDDTGARIDLVYNGGGTGTNYSSEHMKVNREWFTAVSINAQTTSSSPFSGATGMGFGLLANRPTTCTTSTESGLGAGDGGVGYFATDTNILYTCSATNVWTQYYTPYTYPHPLTGAEPEPPAGPTPVVNLRVAEHH